MLVGNWDQHPCKTLSRHGGCRETPHEQPSTSKVWHVYSPIHVTIHFPASIAMPDVDLKQFGDSWSPSTVCKHQIGQQASVLNALQAIQWTAETQGSGAFNSGFTKGVIMESLWHVIMGEPAYMPKASSEDLCNHFSCDDKHKWWAPELLLVFFARHVQ